MLNCKSCKYNHRSLNGLLNLAAENGDEKAVHHLIEEHNVDVNSRWHFSETPLFSAVRCRHTAVVHQLLAYKASADTQNVASQTPLHIAAIYCNNSASREIAHILIDHGAKSEAMLACGVRDEIETVIDGRKRCRTSALTFLGIGRKRVTVLCINGRDAQVMIGMMLWSTRFNFIWSKLDNIAQ